MWHYHTTYLKTGGLFHKPHMSELRRTLLTVPLWDFQSLPSMSPGTERGKLLNRWQWMFLQWLYTHLVTSKPETFSTTRSSHKSTFQLCISWHFKVKARPFQLHVGSNLTFSIHFQPLMSENFEGIPWLFWSNVTFSSVIYNIPWS